MSIAMPSVTVESSSEGELDAELARYGRSLSSLAKMARDAFAGDEAFVVLGGSIVDRLNNSGSDIDLLAITRQAEPSENAVIQGETFFDTLSLADGRLQIERQSFGQIDRWLDQIDTFLDPAKEQVIYLSPGARRVLHRLVTGYALVPSERLDAIRTRLPKARLAWYNLVTNWRESGGSLHDSVGELDANRPSSAAQMLRSAATTLAAALLAEAGETNPNPKWQVRLLEKHASQLSPEDVSGVIEALSLPVDARATETACRKALHRLDVLYHRFRELVGVLGTTKGASSRKLKAAPEALA